MHDYTPDIFRGLITCLVVVATYMIGVVDELFIILVMLMTLDYITGFMSATISKSLSSRIGLIGIVKKVLLLALVVLAAAIDYVLMSSGIFANGYLSIAVVCWLIANEALSILENTAKAGAPYPPVILSALALLRSGGEEELKAESKGDEVD